MAAAIPARTALGLGFDWRQSLVSVTVCVEGGGDSSTLKRMCRKGFSEFFRKAGLAGRMPKIIAGGARGSTYKDFCALVGDTNRGFVILLVDSEAPVSGSYGVWEHLKRRDNWTRPDGAADENAHLMVQCMETWFLADKATLAVFFGNGFNENALPRRVEVENIPKKQLLDSIENATRSCKPKGKYSKGQHSFHLLGQVDPERVTAVSPYARRLIDTLKNKALGRE